MVTVNEVFDCRSRSLPTPPGVVIWWREGLLGESLMGSCLGERFKVIEFEGKALWGR